MEIRGRVHNGVVLLEGQLALPDGTEVMVFCDVAPAVDGVRQKRTEFPLVHSERPGTLQLTAERGAELLEDEDVPA
jgi:hypothetical protein